jgi:hypothetical protein
MMKMSWNRFLLLQVPCVALALALVAQALAFCLSSVPMRRDRPDELALAVSEDPTEYRTLLFGDSTTRNATARFSLGAPGEVGNLATNGYIGLSGSLFLLQRYLKTHPSPEHVVFALICGIRSVSPRSGNFSKPMFLALRSVTGSRQSLICRNAS